MTSLETTYYRNDLMEFIISYTRKERIPPTIDMMIQNVKGLTSKSSVQRHLKALVEEGRLIQKTELQIYYPTVLLDEVLVPKFILKRWKQSFNLCSEFISANQVSKYLKQ